MWKQHRPGGPLASRRRDKRPWEGCFRRDLFATATFLAITALALVLGACGDEDQPASETSPTSSNPTTSTPTATTRPPDDDLRMIAVGDLFDGEGERSGVFTGFVLWDATSARLCEVLMESFPPQCGVPAVVIANPAGLEVELAESGGVRWTDAAVGLTGRFDGDRITLSADEESVEPSPNDQELVRAFIAHALAPSAETATELPFADEVALGLGSRILTTITSDQLPDAPRWDLDVEEYEGFGGPFSALNVDVGLVTVTVGAHNRCAAPPVAAPPGFEALRRVSIQPTDATSCIEWWTIDFFVDEDHLVQAVTLDLFGP